MQILGDSGSTARKGGRKFSDKRPKSSLGSRENGVAGGSSPKPVGTKRNLGGMWLSKLPVGGKRSGRSTSLVISGTSEKTYAGVESGARRMLDKCKAESQSWGRGASNDWDRKGATTLNTKKSKKKKRIKAPYRKELDRRNGESLGTMPPRNKILGQEWAEKAPRTEEKQKTAI